MSAEVQRLRYSRQEIRRDYLRGVAGLGMCALLLVLATPFSLSFWLFSGLGALFLGFILHSAVKHATCLEIHADQIRRIIAVPGAGVAFTQTLDLSRLKAFRLRYFGGRRDRGKGIIELTFRTGAASLTADHSLEHFDSLVLKVSEAADHAGIDPDPATRTNLARMGFK